MLLEDPPLARQIAAAGLRPEAVRPLLASANAAAQRRVILAKHEWVCSTLAARNFGVIGSIHTLLNAIFITATPEQAGIDVARESSTYSCRRRARARPSRPGGAHRTALGEQNKRERAKIAIVDTGIDETHPAFQDARCRCPPVFRRARATI